MDSETKLIEAKIATEDIIADLERVAAKVRVAMIREPGREIYAISPELFEVAKALAGAHKPLWELRGALLAAIGMRPDTRLVPGLF